MLADEEENEFYIKQEIFEKAISSKFKPYLVRSRIFVLKHYAFIDQIQIISLHIKSESEDQEKNEFTAIRNKFLQRPAYQIPPCRCTYNSEKEDIGDRIDFLEKSDKNIGIRMKGYSINSRKDASLPSKPITGGDNDAPEEIDEGSIRKSKPQNFKSSIIEKQPGSPVQQVAPSQFFKWKQKIFKLQSVNH